jgi:hypothetical protein
MKELLTLKLQHSTLPTLISDLDHILHKMKQFQLYEHPSDEKYV